MYTQSKYRSKLYRDFRSIPPGEWRSLVRYYEKHESGIRQLDFDEFFEMLVAYTNALFETGAYEKHQLMSDAVIEASIMNNIASLNGQDIYRQVLFKKAASCYHTSRLEQADHILRELLRIDPDDQDSLFFLKKCVRKLKPGLMRKSVAASVGLFLLSSLLVALEVLIVRNFYAEKAWLLELLRNLIFALGLVSLAGGAWLHHWQAARTVEDFVLQLRQRQAPKV
ncbi:MAG: hypothetical protein RI973_2068 [Bacteroidota bacterium]|jgi:tetratricopeptide (TPR) repeat protein